MTEPFPANQSRNRARLYAAHQATVDNYWNADGAFIWKHPGAHGGYRAMLWHCLSYLAGDAHCVAVANKIIQTNAMDAPCHFTPGAAVDILTHCRAALEPASVDILTRYLERHLPFLTTEDLKIHGYNDNHVYKAAHALIVAGEMLSLPQFVARGLVKLRQAEEVFRRNGFPCEYNSPNYTPVSLCPLAALADEAQSDEARALALRLEQFYWQDVALHFDARAGVPAGPFSRAYVHDYEALLSGTLCLLLHLYPERFGMDLVTQAFALGEDSALIDPAVKVQLPFFQAHTVWYARAEYHLTPALEDALFRTEAGTTVRGTAETGAFAFSWPEGERPSGAPDTHHGGPRRSGLTTYYGDGFSLSTAQYAWLDNAQAHGFYATVNQNDGTAPYFTRMFFDDQSPYDETPRPEYCFRDEGEIRTVQHDGSALVFYNPLPRARRFQRLRTGIYRPLQFSRPLSLWVGEMHVPTLAHISPDMAPVAIDEGTVYVGILPLRLTDLGQSRRAALEIHTYGGHLAVTMSSFEGWEARDWTYAQIMETHAGFVFEMQPASNFASFAAFRQWLASAQVGDDVYADMRTTTYARGGLTLSASYSPYQSAFRYASVNGVTVPVPTFALDGIPDPGCGYTPPAG